MADAHALRAERLGKGDAIPHFRVATVGGSVVAYSTIWQHRNLLLVALPQADPLLAAYLTRLREGQPAFEASETASVITHDAIAGVDAPAVVIADRWGEIIHIATAAEVSDLPALPEILDWLAHIQHRCPECEGDTVDEFEAPPEGFQVHEYDEEDRP